MARVSIRGDNRLLDTSSPMIASLLLSVILTASTLPVTNEKAWESLSFPEVPANKVVFTTDELQIEVRRSASVLLHFFETTQSVKKLRITGKVEGSLKGVSVEKAESPADSLLRVGLIEPGQRKMNPLQRIAAPQWLEDLETRVLEHARGIASIRCYHLLPDRRSIGPMRDHPMTSLLREKNHAAPDAEGNFELLIERDAPIPMIGLWLLADGDDTDSEFVVTIQSIEVKNS